VSDDQQIALKAGEGNWLTARVPIKKDGMYHVAAIEQGENVRMSEDYFIEARKDTPPPLKFRDPDRRQSKSDRRGDDRGQREDDFGLNDMSLHYSVNGGPEK